MNIAAVLEVAIGVLFVWILLAVITSAVQEWISQLLKWKSEMLEEAIGNILADGDLANEFYSHPLIKSLHSQGGKRKPSQIPSNEFASVVFDLIIKAGTEDSKASKAKPVFDKLRESIDVLQNVTTGDRKKLAQTLDTILIDVSTSVEKVDEAMGAARTRVEGWFNDAMDRVGGAYKRRTQVWSLVIGIVLAALLNADSLAIANQLWSDPLAREALVAQAEQLQVSPDQLVDQDAQKVATEYFNQLQSLSQGLSIPLGWTPENAPLKGSPNFWNQWVLKIGGILLSGMAAAQGAPYWFEIMRKLLNFHPGSGSSESASAKKEDEKK